MNKRRLKIIFTVLLACLLCTLTACGVNDKKARFGAAGIGGNYYSFAESFAKVLKEEDSAWDIDVKVTAGSEANVRLLSQNYLELGIAQTDVISDAVGEARTGYSAVAGLYTEACQFVTKADSDIKSIRDLKGKKVSVGESGSGSEKNAKQILAAYGLNDQLADMSYLNYTEAADALKTGKIDAFFCTAGIQTAAIEKLAAQTPIRILPVDGNEGDSLKRMYDHYSLFTIPAGTYTGQEEDVNTVGVKAVLLASDKMSAGTVEELTETLFANADQISASVPVMMNLTEEEAVKGITLPFHKGAAEYYSSKGITVKTGDKGA